MIMETSFNQKMGFYWLQGVFVIVELVRGRTGYGIVIEYVVKYCMQLRVL